MARDATCVAAFRQAVSGWSCASAARKAALKTSPAPIVSTTLTSGAVALTSAPPGPMAIAPSRAALDDGGRALLHAGLDLPRGFDRIGRPARVTVSTSLKSARSQRESHARVALQFAGVQP